MCARYPSVASAPECAGPAEQQCQRREPEDGRRGEEPSIAAGRGPAGRGEPPPPAPLLRAAAEAAAAAAAPGVAGESVLLPPPRLRRAPAYTRAAANLCGPPRSGAEKVW